MTLFSKVSFLPKLMFSVVPSVCLLRVLIACVYPERERQSWSLTVVFESFFPNWPGVVLRKMCSVEPLNSKGIRGRQEQNYLLQDELSCRFLLIKVDSPPSP